MELENDVDNLEIPDYIPPNSDAESDTAIQDQARALGWKPENEYTGNPEKWTDAENFLEVHGKNNGALRKALDKQAAELAEIKKQMQGMDSVHKKMFDLQIKKQKEEFDQQIAFLKSQRSEARKVGDFELAEELDSQLEEVRTKGPDLPDIAEAPKNNQQPQNWRDNPVLASWADKNPWFEKDEDMSAYAAGIGPQIRAKNPAMSFEDLLAEVEAKVRKTFPDRFRSSENRPGKVEGATPGATAGSKARTYASLSKDEKAFCDEAVAEGMKQSEWIASYFEYEDRRKK